MIIDSSLKTAKTLKGLLESVVKGSQSNYYVSALSLSSLICKTLVTLNAITVADLLVPDS